LAFARIHLQLLWLSRQPPLCGFGRLRLLLLRCFGGTLRRLLLLLLLLWCFGGVLWWS
jgi:hypothetical protein